MQWWLLSIISTRDGADALARVHVLLGCFITQLFNDIVLR